MFCRRCSIPHGASTLSSLTPQPPPAAQAHRLRAATWMNGRTALGACLVLLAVLAGAIFLDRAQRLVPVYAAARDLPAGIPLRNGDLMVVRVRLPAEALRHYLQPSPGRAVSGRVLAAPVRRETLVPAELVLASSRDAELVELPVQVQPGDMAHGLRPGDNVRVLAAYTDGARRGRAVILLPSAEVVQVLQDPSGLTGSGQDRGVQLRMPGDRAPLVAAAIATARIFVVKAPGPAPEPADPDPTLPGEVEAPAPGGAEVPAPGGVEAPAPGAGTGEPAPGAGAVEPAPGAGVAETTPGAGAVEPAPGSRTEALTPGAGPGEPTPGAGAEEPFQPSAGRAVGGVGTAVMR
jgi:hypothetical protein